MEQLYVLGTGNATAIKSYNTCFFIRDAEEIFMTDSGGGNGILARLEDMGVELEMLHHVFISHAHMDHCLGILCVVRQINYNVIQHFIYQSLSLLSEGTGILNAGTYADYSKLLKIIRGLLALKNQTGFPA